MGSHGAAGLRGRHFRAVSASQRAWGTSSGSPSSFAPATPRWRERSIRSSPLRPVSSRTCVVTRKTSNAKSKRRERPPRGPQSRTGFDVPPLLAAAEERSDLGAGAVVQAGGTVLRAERVDEAHARDERVVHVVVELVERLLEVGVLADLRADRNHLAGRVDNEVPVFWHRIEEHVRGIGGTDPGK